MEPPKHPHEDELSSELRLLIKSQCFSNVSIYRKSISTFVVMENFEKCSFPIELQLPTSPTHLQTLAQKLL